jgi:hypothetical protein
VSQVVPGTARDPPSYLRPVSRQVDGQHVEKCTALSRKVIETNFWTVRPPDPSRGALPWLPEGRRCGAPPLGRSGGVMPQSQTGSEVKPRPTVG